MESVRDPHADLLKPHGLAEDEAGVGGGDCAVEVHVAGAVHKGADLEGLKSHVSVLLVAQKRGML